MTEYLSLKEIKLRIIYDLDNDGDLDLIGSNDQGYALQVNNGTQWNTTIFQSQIDLLNSSILDFNNDGVLDNPGSILYHKPTRTGQKTNHNIGWGISATISIPLDKRHNEGCLKAADIQNQYHAQATKEIQNMLLLPNQY